MRGWVALLLLAGAVWAAKNKVVFLHVEPSTGIVEVVLDGPPTGDFLDPTKYRLVAVTSSLPGAGFQAVDIQKVEFVLDKGKPTTLVDLTPAKPDDVKGASQILLLVGSDPAVPETKYQKAPPKSNDKPSKSSDIYLSGTYSPGIHSAPQYTIDSAVGLLFPIKPSSTTNYGSWGFLGTVKSDKRRTADPDSYRFYGVYQKVLNKKPHWPLEGVLFTWLAGGLESDSKANNLNFISSPLLDFPIRLRGRITSKKQLVPVLTPEIGVELGNNFTNAVTSTGTGFIARGVLGASLSTDYKPALPLFQNIHVGSSYKVRLPAQPEVYTLTVTNASGKQVDAPFFSTQARHYIKNEIDFGLWKPLSFTVTHEYGTLPPAFRLVDNKVTVGFTVAIQPASDLQGQLTGK
jgi:hypothetical protein